MGFVPEWFSFMACMNHRSSSSSVVNMWTSMLWRYVEDSYSKWVIPFSIPKMFQIYWIFRFLSPFPMIFRELILRVIIHLVSYQIHLSSMLLMLSIILEVKISTLFLTIQKCSFPSPSILILLMKFSFLIIQKWNAFLYHIIH